MATRGDTVILLAPPGQGARGVQMDPPYPYRYRFMLAPRHILSPGCRAGAVCWAILMSTMDDCLSVLGAGI